MLLTVTRCICLLPKIYIVISITDEYISIVVARCLFFPAVIAIPCLKKVQFVKYFGLGECLLGQLWVRNGRKTKRIYAYLRLIIEEVNDKLHFFIWKSWFSHYNVKTGFLRHYDQTLKKNYSGMNEIFLLVGHCFLSPT